MNKKTPQQSVCESRKIVMPDQINPHGTLFGGVTMTWIDKIAYMCAQNYAECISAVTASIEQIQFLTPAHLGDQVLLRAVVSYTGKSSMEIDVTIHKENPIAKNKILIATAFLTFVALDKNGAKIKVPELALQTEEDFLRYKNAYSRVTLRQQFKRVMEENKKDHYLPLEVIPKDHLRLLRKNIITRIKSGYQMATNLREKILR